MHNLIRCTLASPEHMDTDIRFVEAVMTPLYLETECNIHGKQSETLRRIIEASGSPFRYDEWSLDGRTIDNSGFSMPYDKKFCSQIFEEQVADRVAIFGIPKHIHEAWQISGSIRPWILSLQAIGSDFHFMHASPYRKNREMNLDEYIHDSLKHVFSFVEDVFCMKNKEVKTMHLSFCLHASVGIRNQIDRVFTVSQKKLSGYKVERRNAPDSGKGVWMFLVSGPANIPVIAEILKRITEAGYFAHCEDPESGVILTFS